MRKKDEKILKVYNFIESYISDNGFAPSVREICSACAIKSTASVYCYIEELVEKGLITKANSKNRAINSAKAKCSFKTVPIVGVVTAGQPILAVENIEGYYPLPDEYGQDVFMLSVKGDSMVEAGIFNGDKIIVRKQSTANNGDIVVAFWDDGATVKRFYKKDTHFVLHPENSAMDDIIVENVDVLGKVVGLMRKM